MIDELRPEVVVVDPLLYVGLGACRAAKARVAVLWPAIFEDVVVVI